MPLAIKYRGRENLKPVDSWFKDFDAKFDQFQAKLSDCIIRECQAHLDKRYNTSRTGKRSPTRFNGKMGDSFKNKSNWKVRVSKNGDISIQYTHKDKSSSVDKLHIIDHGTRPISGENQDQNYGSPVEAFDGVERVTRSEGDRRTWLQSFQFEEGLGRREFVDAGTRRYEREPLTGSYGRRNKKDDRGTNPKGFRKSSKSLNPRNLSDMQIRRTTNFSESTDMDNSLMDRPMGEFRRNIKEWADQKFGWEEGESGYWARMLGLWDSIATQVVDNKPEPKIMSGDDTGLFLDKSPPYKTPSPILKQIIRKCIRETLNKDTGKSGLVGKDHIDFKGAKGRKMTAKANLLIQNAEVITMPSRRMVVAVTRNNKGQIVKWLGYGYY